MKGDFSRLRFNPSAQYTSVLEQQGRVNLDADANEQCAINAYLRDTEAIDIIGPFGGPSGDLGFAITVTGNRIGIGPGRYYVQGILCENQSQLGYMQQPYLIDPPVSDSQLLAGLQNGSFTGIKVFLEVWQRLVTALDDSCLREPALGGADTAARLQTVWRVVAEGVPPPGPTRPPVRLPPIVGRLPVDVALGQRFASGARFLATLAEAPAFSTAPEVPTATAAAGAISCCADMYSPVLDPEPGSMNAQTTGGAAECSCEPTPAAGYRGVENQLYRVEIHNVGQLSEATFKWSRENASVVAAVTAVSGNRVLVNSLGPDANLGFAPGQWVEITDDTYQFGVPANRAGQLYQIQSVTPSQLSVTVAPPVSGIDVTRNARMRRWDQSGAEIGPSGIPLSTSWTDLENGIQVQFAAGFYRSGDYWLIPARTATGAIDWPPCGAGGAAFQPTFETNILRAPLACIHWTDNQQFAIEECRRQFPPLTTVTPGAAAALHVTETNWNNDDVLTFDQMLATGLSVSLDQASTSRIDASTFTVTLEVPVVSKIEEAAVSRGLAPIVLRVSNPLDGQVTVNGANITWNLPFRNAQGNIPGIQLEALGLLDLMLLQGVGYFSFARARVRLSGHDIFAGSGANQVFLDGQTFGAPGFRADKVTPCTSLTFPSGASLKASDFESWFFLAPTLSLTALTVQPNAVNFNTTPAPPTPVATLTVNYPALADTVVSLSVITPAGTTAAVTVPATVAVPRTKNSVSFSVTVRNTGDPTAQNFPIVASLKNALGFSSTVSATLTVTGFPVIQ
jgi:hypothetical protein